MSAINVSVRTYPPVGAIRLPSAVTTVDKEIGTLRLLVVVLEEIEWF